MRKEFVNDNGTMTIIGNGHDIPLLDGCELTEKERNWWSDLINVDESTFFRYKGHCYFMGDFIQARRQFNEYGEYDGYMSDCFFSGILIKVSEGYETIKAYTYIC